MANSYREASETLQATVGKTIASVEPLVGQHWDGTTFESGAIVTFTDGTKATLYGLSIQSEGYLGAEIQEQDVE